ncbi:hypothetical protein MHYP_G00240950 [Metynnis hypsauchen]
MYISLISFGPKKLLHTKKVLSISSDLRSEKLHLRRSVSDLSVLCVSAERLAEGGLAGVQFSSGCRRPLRLHRRRSRTEPVLQRREEQATPTAPGEGLCVTVLRLR